MSLYSIYCSVRVRDYLRSEFTSIVFNNRTSSDAKIQNLNKDMLFTYIVMAEFDTLESIKQLVKTITKLNHEEEEDPEIEKDTPVKIVTPIKPKTKTKTKTNSKVVSYNSDGACSGTNNMRYRVCDNLRNILFDSKVYSTGTNNIAEFLGLCKSLEMAFNSGIVNIYTDSVTAMCWVRTKNCNTTHSMSKDLKLDVDNALLSIKHLSIVKSGNDLVVKNTSNETVSIIKWDTKTLGEIPSDFGNK